jgi:GNAT superfamily N-acetyltransferase
MKEKLLIRLFNEADAEAVQDIIHRGLREINGKDYPPELIEEYCAYFTLEKIKSQAVSAHMYVAASGDKILGTGSIAPYWGSEKESILLTIYVLPEMIGQGIGTAIINALEQDEYFLRANRIEIPSSITAVNFYEKMGYAPKNGIEPDEEGIVPMEKFK